MVCALELEDVSPYWIDGRLPRSHHQPISARVKSGEWLGVCGVPNIGKSTLLHAIAGTVDRCAGRVIVGGLSLPHSSPVSRFSAGVVHVPQEPAIPLRQATFDDASALAWLRRRGIALDRPSRNLKSKLQEIGLLSEDKIATGFFDFVTAILAMPRVLLLDDVSIPGCPRDLFDNSLAALRQLLPLTTVIFVDRSPTHALETADKVLVLRADRPPRLIGRSQRDEFGVRPLCTSITAYASEYSILEKYLRRDLSLRAQVRLALRAAGGGRRYMRLRYQGLCEAFEFLKFKRRVEDLTVEDLALYVCLIVELSNVEPRPCSFRRDLPQYLQDRLDVALSDAANG